MRGKGPAHTCGSIRAELHIEGSDVTESGMVVHYGVWVNRLLSSKAT